MDASMLLEYGWVLLILVGLEGILSIDNALVMAVMIKHLPEKERKKALFYGLAGAFVFRFAALFVISFLVNIWQVQALGAAYLIFLGVNHIAKTYLLKEGKNRKKKAGKESGFWMTVVKVNIADLVFAIDSILAAFALAITLPVTPFPTIGGMDGGQFAVIFIAGIIGIVFIRLAASMLVNLLYSRPNLETAAYLIVGWVGIKLAIHTLAHPSLHIIPHEFPESALWNSIFWVVLIAIAAGGFFLSGPKVKKADETKS